MFLWRYFLLQAVGIAGLLAAYFSGWVHDIYVGDSSKISVVILGLFLVGLVVSTKQAISKKKAKLGWLATLADSLVILGLIGTVVGFIKAMTAINPGEIANIETITYILPKILNGAGIALHTTLVGSVLYLWTSINYRTLLTAMQDKHE